jgi:4-amino-4-deoxy-L-arabinose transferase-like glycosyltransferase
VVDAAWNLAFLVLLTASALGYGLRVVDGGDRAGRLALGLLLGLGMLALSAFGLGELGWLSPGSLAALLALGVAVGPWRRWGDRAEGPTSLPIGAAVLTGLVVVATLFASLAPVTDGDALCYHLEVSKRFLADGAVGFDPDLHETVYPLVKELLDTYALALATPSASRLVSWLTGVALALSVASLARPVLGHGAALWAVAAALSVPAVSNGMSAPLNDVALASFCAGALLAWVQWFNEPTLRHAALAGALGGLALGVKYPALVWIGWLVVGQVIATARDRRRHTLGQLALYLLLLGLVGAPWYARAWLWTGNPVYPFFRETFGGAGLAEVLDPTRRPMTVSPWNLLTALGPMTLQPDRFDSFSHQFGPLFLMFLPALLLFWPRAPRRVQGLAVIGFVFLTACLTRRQSMRFVLAVVGPWAVVVAWAVLRGMGQRPSGARRVAFVAFVGVLSFQTAIAVARTRLAWPVLAGRETVAAYLERCEPTSVVGGWMAAHLPVGARVIGQDHRGFYLTRPYTMELAHRRRTGLGTRGESADEVVATLRARGFTHLLMCPPVPEDAVEFDGRLGELLGDWLRVRRPIYRQDLTDGDGVVRRYALFDLTAAVETRVAQIDDEVPR